MRAAAWILAVAGPAALTVAALPLHALMLQGGFLFASLVLVIALAVAGGIGPALTALVLAVVARAVLLMPPVARPPYGEPFNMVALIGFVIAGLVITVLIDRLGQLAAEQAALWRVATRVAHAAPAAELFATATEEAGRLAGADYACIGRYTGRDLTRVAVWMRPPGRFPARGRWTPGRSLIRSVVRAGRAPATGDLTAYGALADDVGALGLRTRTVAPVNVGGRTWGVILAGSTVKWTPPPCTKRRLAAFADLLAAALVNEESRADIARLAAEQAALRRVATLVARGAQPEALFAAVTKEASQLLGVEITTMIRYESDGTSTIVASWREGGKPFLLVGDRQPLGGNNLATIISRTHSPARLDHYGDVTGARVIRIAKAGFRSAVGAPIMVQGRLWGAVIAASADEHALSPDSEARVGSFTDLVATAVSNAQTLAELTASRARVVAAGDEARRQIERDLHDGAQQRLVSLSLAARAAQAAIPPARKDLDRELAGVADGLTSVLDDLRELARGIHPTILSEGGLVPALKVLARRSRVPVELELGRLPRLPEPIEVAAYYVVSEMLTNAAKHSNASVVEVGADVSGDALHLRVADDGRGGADPALGSGLVGLKDRIEALGGKIAVDSPVGSGTRLMAELPLAA
jgi:signal transduction histidine kinase